jgi:hypothetical protein
MVASNPDDNQFCKVQTTAVAPRYAAAACALGTGAIECPQVDSHQCYEVIMLILGIIFVVS